MGGVCAVVEAVITLGFVAQGISQAVLKAKIRELLKGHEEEFNLMISLNGFVEKLLTQKNLVSQLDVGTSFAANNWNTIFRDLSDKNELLKRITGKFSNVRSSAFKENQLSYLKYSITALSMMYVSYNIFSGRGKAEISASAASFKEFCKATSAKIRGLAPEIRVTRVTPQGSLQTGSVGTSVETIPSQARQSNVERVRAQEKSGIKTKVVTGIRLIFVAVAIYFFVQGAIGLAELGKQLSKYQEYFKSGGDFEQAEDGVMELMNCVAADISNLAYCSRAAIYDAKNLFLVKSIALPAFQELNLAYSKKLNPDSFGLTQDFMDQTNYLLNFCNALMKSGKSRKDKLRELEGQFKIFFEEKKPEQVFMNISIELSQVFGKYSLISQHMIDDQHNAQRFLKNVSEYFIDERGSKFSTKSPEEKQQIDTSIFEKSWQNYKAIYQVKESMPIDQASQTIKDTIFQAIVSFCDEFFYDDLSGQTFFGKNILEGKQEAKYGEILSHEYSDANIIPVRKENIEEEKKELQDWGNLAKAQNEKEGFKYWTVKDEPKPRFRYIRLEAGKVITPKGEEVATLLSFEGVRLKLNEKLFNFERNVVTGSVVLANALVKPSK